MAGEIPCTKVYETSNVLAFLDINPVIKGHTLVIPKEHVVNIMDIPDDLASELQQALRRIGNGLLQGLDADGFNLGMNNFESAGQLVMHAHYHLIPRYKGDGLKLWAQGSYESNEQMQDIAGKIKSAV